MRYFGFQMRIRLFAPLACLMAVACQKSDVKVLIGATAITAPGAASIEDSVIVVAGGRIRAIGARKDVPIPQDSERLDLTGKQIAPAEGARIAVNESADLEITGPGFSRRMVHGQWNP